MSDRFVCEHGYPMSWDFKPFELEDRCYRSTVTVKMCKQCVENGTAQQIAQWIGAQFQRIQHEHLTNAMPNDHERG